MGRKRYKSEEKKLENGDSEEPPCKLPKEEKENETEETSNTGKFKFDVKHFRKELSAPSNRSATLLQFLHVCEKSNGSVDYICKYLEGGGSPGEILNQLDNQDRKNIALGSTVFSLLNLVLLKIQSKMPHLLHSAEDTCRYFLNNYVPSIEYMLSDKATHKYQNITLKLLSTMVMLNSELGVAILTQLSFQPKVISHLAKPDFGKERNGVRGVFVYFVMSFFVEGNASLIKALLDKHGLLALILPDLSKDNSETVLMVIQLLKKTLLNNNITKTLKLRTFNHHFISYIFNLFNWKGPSKSEKDRVHKEEISEAVGEFLEVLCSSHKYGIYFTDKRLGMGDVPTNQCLWSAFECLESPWNNPSCRTLFKKIIKNSPDLFRPIRRMVVDTWSSESDENHNSTLTFLCEIVESLSVDSVIKLFGDLNESQIFDFIKFTYFPNEVMKKCAQLLKSKTEPRLKHGIILFLQLTTKKLKAYLDSSDLRTIKNDLKNKVEDLIRKYFLPPDQLLMDVHRILDTISTDEIFYIECETVVPKGKYLIDLLDLLLLYDDLVPFSFDPFSIRLDSKRIFEKGESVSENGIELKLKTTILLLRVSKNAFALNEPLFKEILLAVSKVYMLGDLPNMMNEAEYILKNILNLCGIFENDSAEIDALLYSAKSIDNEVGDVSHVFTNLIENIALGSVKYKESLIKCTKNTDDTANENFETILNDLISYNKNDKHFTFKSRSITYFLVGLLDNFSNTKEHEECLSLLAERFIVTLLHLQETPNVVLNILNEFDFNMNVKKYVNSWKSVPKPMNKSIFSKNHVLHKVSKILLSEEMEFDRVILKDINASDLNAVFNMTLFHLIQQNTLSCLNDSNRRKIKMIVETVIKNYPVDDVSNKQYTDLIQRCFGTKKLQQCFDPLIEENEEFHPLTEFIFDLIELCRSKSVEVQTIDLYLTPYKHILYMKIKDEADKCKCSKKGMKFKDLDRINDLFILNSDSLVALLKQIVSLDVSSMAVENNEPSSWIQIVCHILNQTRKQNFNLNSKEFTSVLQLYSKIIKTLDFVMNVSLLEENVYECALNDLNLLKAVPVDIFEDMFSIKHVNKCTFKLAALLLEMNAEYLTKFSKMIVEEGVIDRREFVFPLAMAAMSHSEFKQSTVVFKAIYERYRSNISKVIEKPHKATQMYIDNIKLVVRLINDYKDVSECSDFFKKVHKFDVTESFHLDILEALYFKTLFNNSINMECFTNFLLCILNMATNILKRDQVQHDKVLKISTILNKIMIVFDMNTESSDEKKLESLSTNSIWLNFFKHSLMAYLKPEDVAESESLFGVICKLIDALYPDGHSKLVELFEMTSSHSEFLNIMIGNNVHAPKKCLVKLLNRLVCKNKDNMKASHIPVYLGSYQATNDECDRNILNIIKMYEDGGVSVSEYRPYLWSDAGAHHYALKSNRKTLSLWSNPTVNHTLSLLDRDRTERTLKNFPLFNGLNDDMDDRLKYSIVDVIHDLTVAKSSDFNLLKKTPSVYKSDKICAEIKIENYTSIMNKLTEECTWKDSSVGSDVYDPSFVIPLLSFILAPGSAVFCHRVIRCGILSIPLMALSSPCSSTRAAAYNVLYRFKNQLDAEMFYKNDKLLWGQFINTVKSSLLAFAEDGSQDPRNPRIPTICALYMARAAVIMTNPLDPLFVSVNSFIITKQSINFTVVPDFLDLFHNPDIAYAERRTWILEVMRDGMKTFADVKVLLKGVLFKILFDFYNSSLANNGAKVLIVEIVDRAVCIPKAAKILTDSYGLIPWLSYISSNVSSDNNTLLSAVVNAIHNLTIGLMIESTVKLSKMNKDKIKEMILNEKCFKINAGTEFNLFCLLTDLLNNVTATSGDVSETYLSVLSKISAGNLKLMTNAQILKLARHLNTPKIILQDIQKAVSGRNLNLLTPLTTWIDHQSSALKSKEKAMRFLYEILTKWMM